MIEECVELEKSHNALGLDEWQIVDGRKQDFGI
jgi:hypothetical protein